MSSAIGGATVEIYSATGGGVPDGRILQGELPSIAGSALISYSSPTGYLPTEESSRGSNGGVISYIVKDGDTISAIAEEFGISVNTILWENKLTARSVIRPGTKLSILPVDGVKHTVTRGDTISAIALRYKGDAEEILTYNNLAADQTLSIGDTIIIPDGKPVPTTQTQSSSASSAASAPSAPARSLIDATGYFVRPSSGRLTQGLHRYNAVDIGGSEFCDGPVLASAAGTVIASLAGGWNGGYGNFIKISHANGTISLYGHNSQNLVSVGQTVNQGQVIALMGSTGNSTGCHVHFEIRGARNPFAQ